VDPRDVLVADALDAVAAEAVAQKRRALQGFARGELEGGETLLELIAGAEGAGGAGGEARAGPLFPRARMLIAALSPAGPPPITSTS